MNPKSLDAVIVRYVGFGLLFLSLLVLLYMVRDVLPVFIVAGVIAYALEPLLQRLEKRGRNRSHAVAYIFGVYVLLLLVLFSMLTAGIQQGQSFVTAAPAQFEQVSKIVERSQEKLQSSGLPQSIKDSINQTIDNSTKSVRDQGPTLVKDFGTRLVTGTGALLINIFLLTLISFGLMLEAQRIRARLLMLVPPLYRRDVTDLSVSINELLGRYVRGQLIVCGTYGALCTVAFEILSRIYGMQYPLILGAMAACIYILPYFGMATITISAGLTAYLTAQQQVPCAIAAVACCIAFNLIVDYGIAPRVLGRGVGLHPLMVVFALLCGYQLGGPLGTVVAVPIFASLRVIAIYLFPQLAVPLPDESPQATAQSKNTSPTTEMAARVASAESSVENIR